ncbi:hypothetical protein [Ruegeria sp.]|uniref:hypothetical protein n=1 Tax=Ruegeria sp. TaxID=1879320 RepID=UPI002314B249|nr:hypothetical protein [Ruegeria sp.]MDA7966219.1 hypothetical protein [Ruegeria sp.]
MTKDFGGSIIAQLVEVGLHARYSKDIDGASWARERLTMEAKAKGWALPPYSHIQVSPDSLAEFFLRRFLEQSELAAPVDEEVKRHRNTNSVHWIAAQMVAISRL